MRMRVQVQRDLRQAHDEKQAVHCGLRSRPQPRSDSVRAQIPEKQRGLKENQAGGPHRCRSSQKRQQALPRDGFNQKKEAAAEKDCGSIKKGTWAHERTKIDRKSVV